MNFSVLDCTLRDGGYCNEWRFSEKGIKQIINNLIISGIENIECGFLTNKVPFDSQTSKFTMLKQLDKYIPQHNERIKFLLMVNYGEYNIEDLPPKTETMVDGIRVAFHKKDRYAAIELCEKIKTKGYYVFLQPMVSMLYSEQEFLELINLVNKIEPYAFYIVDSFGTMDKKNLQLYLKLAEEKLSQAIKIGFHSHNNLQSAFSNAQFFLECQTTRDLIVDSSVYGMGRGAGNLNTELLLNMINEKSNKKYTLEPVFQIMDLVLNHFYEEKPWGYNLPNYLSAIHMIHPNYGVFLSEKKTLKVEDINKIFSQIDPIKGCEFDKEYINALYIKYMSSGHARDEHLAEVIERTKGKKVLLIAPGKNALREKQKIINFIEVNSPIIISINHEYPIVPSDYIFISNKRRFANMNEKLYSKTISTSNINTDKTYISIDYLKLINTNESVKDNAGLMAINFAIKFLNSEEIFIAGFDGYSYDYYSNFETDEMALIASKEFIDRINEGMRLIIREFKEKKNITFITSSLLNN